MKKRFENGTPQKNVFDIPIYQIQLFPLNIILTLFYISKNQYVSPIFSACRPTSPSHLRSF